MILAELFLAFLKIGCFSFGGAYGAIPLIRDEVMSRGWMTAERLTDMIAVSESTPGPIMVNVATFVGMTKGGIPGALLATFAVILPAFLIILLAAAILEKCIKNKYVRAVTGGLIPCVIGLVTATGAFMVIDRCLPESAASGADTRAWILTAILAAALFLPEYLFHKRVSPILLIVISAALGIALYSF